VIYNTLDVHTVAVDGKTGKLVWDTKLGDVNIGETMTMAPVVVKNRVIVGVSGGEMGVWAGPPGWIWRRENWYGARVTLAPTRTR